MIKEQSRLLGLLLDNNKEPFKNAMKRNARLEYIKYNTCDKKNYDCIPDKVYDFSEILNTSDFSYIPTQILLTPVDLPKLSNLYVIILVCSWNKEFVGDVCLMPTDKHLKVESDIYKVYNVDPQSIFYLDNAVCCIRYAYE